MCVRGIIFNRCLSIPVTIQTIFSYSSIIPVQLAAAISEHRDAIRQFQLQLASNKEKLVSDRSTVSSASLAYDERVPTSSVAGLKRKRIV